MRKKKRLFYDSKKICCARLFFLVFIFSFFNPQRLIFTDFEFSLIVLSELIHTNILVGNI